MGVDSKRRQQQQRKSTAVGGARTAEKNMNGVHQTGCWWCIRVTVPVRQRYFKRMRPRKVCVKMLTNAFKLLANQQKDCDSLFQSIVTGLRERNW